MPNVYRVGSIYGTTYFNTAREADRHKPGGEEPEEVIRLDAAGECNRLSRYLDVEEQMSERLRYLLYELAERCEPGILSGTDVGRQVQKMMRERPIATATAAERDGGRSYGI